MSTDTGSLEQRIGALSPERRRALEKLLKKQGAPGRRPPLTPRPAELRDLPLSFAQQRLWFLDQMETGAAYNIASAMRLGGALDVPALQATLDEIVRRHEVLRTTFANVDGNPIQVVSEAGHHEMRVEDVSGLEEAERRAEALAICREEADRPFDLARGPLFRVALLKLGPEEHWLHFCLHHIVYDGWSVGVLTRELSALYAAFSAGRPKPLEELPVQYADFARWQRQWLQGDELERQLAYWRRRLEGAQRLRLDTDRPRPQTQTFGGAIHRLAFPPELAQRLNALCRAEGVTLFMVLLAGFKALLSRYAGQQDIVLGSPIANRQDRQLESLMGFFVNSLVLRTDLSGSPTFRELIGRVRETALEAYDHQDVPFEKLVEELEPERNLAHNPLYQVVFAVQNTPYSALELPGLTLQPLPTPEISTRFDLEVFVWEAGGQLTSAYHYNTALFDPETIEALSRHYVNLLDAAASRPEARLSELPLLGREEEETEAFWRRELGDFTAPTGLPSSHPGGSAAGPEAQELALSEEESAAVRALLHSRGVGLPALLQGVWALLLSRHSGERDVVLGAVPDGDAPAAAAVPVRVQVRDDEPAAAWLRRLQERQAELARHGHARAVDLQTCSGVPRGLPLFESLVGAGDAPPSPERGPAATPEVPLLLSAADESPIALRLRYDAGRFEAVTARTLLEQARTLLGQLAGNGEAVLVSLSLVTPESRALLPDPARPLPAEDLEPVTATIEARARRAPDAPALSHAGAELSYAELSERMRALARRLRAEGHARGDVVALDAEPSFGLIVGITGVWLAGGVVLLLDRRLPAERRRLMCRASGAKRLLRVAAGTAPGDDLAAALGLPVSLLAPSGLAPSGAAPRAARDGSLEHPAATDPAYVFFTSGTTGGPKGILGTHRGLSHFVAWQRDTFDVGPGDRSSQLTGLSFDAILREIFLPLVSGATLCLPEDAAELGAEGVLPWLARERVSILHTVPTLARTWLAGRGAPAATGALRCVFFSGEPLTSGLVSQWRESASRGATLINLYGPTETTLTKCFYVVPEAPPAGALPVGRPLPGTQALVLAPGGRLCGVGERGEIAIRTPYRTLGYVDAPEADRRRFAPNPFRRDGTAAASDHGADLVYYTGDSGAYRPDGQLELGARLDDQVKIRGVRLEPAEVESALAAHTDVRQCAVVARETTAGEKQLVAYVVAGGERRPEVAALRAHLKQTLPDTHLPGAFAFLEALPVTPNGKLDRRALPAPESVRGRGRARLVEPRTPLEEELAGLWRELLDLEAVGVHDDFFDVGGHSLLATRLISRIRAALGVELPIRALFESPTVAGLAERIESGRTGALRPQRPPLRPASREADLPLSFAQQRLWFIDQMKTGAAYNIPWALRLRGALDAAALEASLNELVRRHEVLRTLFPADREEPVQHVLPSLQVPWSVVDLRSLDEDDRERAAQRLAEEEARRPFDLSEGPLLRASLLQLDRDEHALLVTLHHIVTDAWSRGVLTRELAAHYEALSAGRSAELSPLPIQYGDFARWQRDWLQGDVLESLLGYWRERLDGVPQLELPTDRPRPAVQTFRGAHCVQPLPSGLVDSLRELSRAQGATLFMVLLAGFKALLSRYTGQQDIAVGSPIANRQHSDLEDLIGFFVNSLVLRTDLSGSPTFEELVGRVRETALGAYDHQDLPFEKLVEELAPERDLAQHPLFQVVFAVQNAPRSSLELAGLKLEMMRRELATTRFDLEIHVNETRDGLTVVMLYNADLFDAATVDSLARHYVGVLASAVKDPTQRVDRMSLLTPEERDRVLVGWNATGRDRGEGPLVHRLVEEHARRAPDAVAGIGSGARLSYGELNARSNRLAHHLRRQGVGPDAVVAVCCERSPELLVALLATLKAGAAYLPVDPDYPQERVAYLLSDAGAALTLCQERCRAALPESFEGRVVWLDRAASDWGDEPDTDPGVEVAPTSLAYVIYTSGSTGRPKGVEIEHRNLLNLVHWHRDAYGVTHRDRGTQLASIGFDACVWELWPYLASGASVAFAGPEVRQSPEALRDWLVHEEATVSFVPTALAEPLLDLEWPDGIALRALLTGGDRLRRYAPETLPFVLVNHYGPTEGTVVATCGTVPTMAPAGRAPSIGRPIAGARVYLLDANGQPVPPGVTGELHVGGAGVARGYRGQPDLTRERFVEDTFSGKPGARLYRTGDLARHRHDGEIEFVGRDDHQVKVRGFRIELGEIEAVLREHPAVRDAAVVVREDAGEPRLVAYPVGDAEPAALRQHLRERLPEHMVPAVFVSLDALPVTPHGKLDRDALPAPHGERQLENAFVAPTGELQEKVAAVWRDLLGLDRVGARDNFFDLGGHSMLIVRLQRRLRDELDVEVPIVELFRNPTVETLTRQIGGERVRSAPIEEARARLSGRRSAAAGDDAVAIVGMAGRFPGADGVEAFWSNLRNGVESIRFFGEEELRASGVPEQRLRSPRFVPAHGAVDGQELLDAAFFGYNPREAELIDPQQRQFLECAWEALERAGIDPRRFAGLIGVYAGSSFNSYFTHLLSQGDRIASGAGIQLALSSDKDFLATRVSYKLNLRGPSLTVQTACSTSLVAVHEACRSLRARDCDVALAGGVSIKVPWNRGYVYVEEGIVSPDGHCRAFDEAAQGTTRGDGVGIVVLKRLDEAVADRDHIHAVIRGTAVNNDGSAKVGYTAPSVEGQSRAIALALAAADVEPESVGYVETHGTGTALGDPIEVAALAEVFGAAGREPGSVALGAVKTNVGHLDAAAGVTGLIKAALSLEHGELPPTLHFERPNPRIDFGSTPFYVNQRLKPWSANGVPRRAGVSSFGLGGTNAHAVLEEAPRRDPSGPSRPWQVLTVSARTPDALDQASASLGRHLRERPEQALPDVAHTLQVGRAGFEWRRAVLCRDREEAAQTLLGERPGHRVDGGGPVPDTVPSVVFLFPGQGTQQVGMARRLDAQERVFRESLDLCAEGFAAELDIDLREVLYSEDDGAAERLAETSLAQAALFSVELALARLWMSWGVTPVACIGHSIGEYVAACVAGVMDTGDAVRAVARRGRLMDATPRGAMLAVPLSEAELSRELGEGVWLAAVNAPELCVVSGDEERIATLEQELGERGIEGRRLATSHAFHSARMEAAVEPLVRELRATQLRTPRIPFVSNVTGTWITDSQATDPAYWGEHLRRPVRYSEGVRTLLGTGPRLLLEVGPGRTLTALAEMQMEQGGDHEAVSCLPHPRDPQPEDVTLLGALARLWAAGVEVDWAGFSADETRDRVTLPTYPFQRERFWIDAGPQEASEGSVTGAFPAAPAGDRLPVDQWFAVPSWRRSAHLPPPAAGRERWCLFVDGSWLGTAMTARLRELGHEVAVVERGSGFERLQPFRYRIDPARRTNYDALVQALSGSGEPPATFVHLTAGDAGSAGDSAFRSLLFLAQALGEAAPDADCRITAVTTGMQEVLGGDEVAPERATAAGPCRVIPQEYPGLSCRSVDVPLEEIATAQRVALVDCLLGEAVHAGEEVFVAYRGGQRWLEHFEPVSLPADEGPHPLLREAGVYLVTGGLTGIGFTLAEHLARSVAARLVLVGRTPLPGRGEWDDRLAGPADGTTARIRNVRALEALGAEVLVLSADVSDSRQAARVVAKALDRFGTINGVVHSAGVPGARMIQVRDEGEEGSVLAPKLAGTRNLDELLKEVKLDFMLLCSSLASTLGGVGQVEYCAANAFLDAFAKHRTATTGRYTVAVDWDTWREVGMAVDVALPPGVESAREQNLRLGLGSAEGVEVFRRVLRSGLSQVLVTTRDLHGRRARRALRKATHRVVEKTRHPRPLLQDPYQPPQTATEQALAELWEEHLGVEQVGIHDNFFELGGHSLLATQLVAVLRSRFERPISIASIFEHPTVHGLAAWLDSGGGGTAVATGSRRGGKRKAALMQAASRRR